MHCYDSLVKGGEERCSSGDVSTVWIPLWIRASLSNLGASWVESGWVLLKSAQQQLIETVQVEHVIDRRHSCWFSWLRPTSFNIIDDATNMLGILIKATLLGACQISMGYCLFFFQIWVGWFFWCCFFFLIGNSEHIKLVGHESNRWTGGSASLAYGSSGRADLFCNEGKYVIHGKRSNLFKCIEILFKD